MKGTILIVENDLGTRGAWIRALAEGGFRVLAVPHGSNTMFQFGLIQPDLVILQPRPGAKRWGLLRQIRSLSSAPVITLVDDDDTDSIVESLDSGADQVLTRPVDVRELVARVRVLLRRSRDTGWLDVRAGELDVSLAAQRRIYLNY